jgi:hypothetical protein
MGGLNHAARLKTANYAPHLPMRNPARQGRPDSNHAQVRAWYEALYCSVIDLHEVGHGCPDFLIGVAGRSELVEVKTEHGHLEASQIRFQDEWRGSKVQVVVTHADVINHVLNVSERVSRGVQ